MKPSVGFILPQPLVGSTGKSTAFSLGSSVASIPSANIFLHKTLTRETDIKEQDAQQSLHQMNLDDPVPTSTSETITGATLQTTDPIPIPDQLQLLARLADYNDRIWKMRFQQLQVSPYMISLFL